MFESPITPLSIRAVRLSTTLTLALILVCHTSLVDAADGAADRVSQFAKVRTLSELVSRMGRDADKADAAGACGGIVVHDWVAENIRVIALGESVQAVSVLREPQPVKSTE